MKVLRVSPMYKCIGLVDADLIDGGTRHPNLALLKIAGFLFNNHVPFELIFTPRPDLTRYERIYMSKVFTFTREPAFYRDAPEAVRREKFVVGGTGYYANETSVSEFRRKRTADMTRLERDALLQSLPRTNRYGEKPSGGVIFKKGIDVAHTMPYYHLYDIFIDHQVKLGKKREHYTDYLHYSIGFLTRRCYRHCPFCVNKLENGVVPYSRLEDFHDPSRPHVYFWDDNFLAAPYEVWQPTLQHLIDHRISFQFRQGLDERQLAENEHGEEMAEMLSRARYHGDYIFAFDNWRDRPVIERALKVWKRHNPKKGTKFYLFCGFRQRADDGERFYRDIWELFQRIRVLMQYGCVGYVMRHEDYHLSPIPNFYVQVARWCNQQAFYKKMSFWQFCYRNQTYWEEHTLNAPARPKLATFEAFERDIRNGYYERVKMCLPLRTVLATLEMFPQHRDELIEMYNYTMTELTAPSLWQS